MTEHNNATEGLPEDPNSAGGYLVLSWDSGGRIVPLHPGTAFQIGRDPQSEVHLDVASLSRKHVAIRVSSDGETKLEDLGSSHGVIVDGRRLEPGVPVRLRTGEVYKLAAVSLVYHGENSAGLSPIRYRPIGEPMIRCESLLSAMSNSTVPVTIEGEAGSGKSHYARLFHAQGKRHNGTLFILDARGAADSEALLFGPGDGKQANEGGMLYRANGGRCIVEHFGYLNESAQLRLAAHCDQMAADGYLAHLVLTSHAPVEKLAEQGLVAPELASRLVQGSVTLPPLRDRLEDIVPLFRFAVDRIAERRGTSSWRLQEDAVERLQRYPWPGNVRELFQLAELATALSRSAVIDASHLSFQKVPFGHTDQSTAVSTDERERIVRALDSCGGNQTRAAVMLGISRRTLVTRLDQFNIRRPKK